MLSEIQKQQKSEGRLQSNKEGELNLSEEQQQSSNDHNNSQDQVDNDSDYNPTNSNSNILKIPSLSQQISNDISLTPNQRASIFKNKMDFSHLQPLPYKNPIADRLAQQKKILFTNSANSTPKSRNTPINGVNNFSTPKSGRQQAVTQPSEEEKSLLLEGTFNMGYGNLKQLELDLKWELKNRGLLKNDQQKQDIKNFFPALEKYQKGKIEQKIQRIKEKAQKIEESVASNIQVQTIKDSVEKDQSQAIKITDVYSPIIDSSFNDKSPKPLDLESYQKQNPLVKIDFNCQSPVVYKQYTQPVIPARSVALPLIEPPLYLPKINKNTQSLSLKIQNTQQLRYQGSASPTACFLKNINQVTSYTNIPLNRNLSVQLNSRGRTEDIDALKGYKCGSPHSQKVSSNFTPRSQLQRSAQSVLDNIPQKESYYSFFQSQDKIQMSSQSNRIKTQASPKQIVMKDAIIQTLQDQQTSNEQLISEHGDSPQKKKDIEPSKQKSTTEQGQTMLQRINYSRPIIFHNILNRERKPFNINNIK